MRGVCLRVFIFPSLKRMPAPPFYSSRERSGYKENGVTLVLATVWSDFGGMAPVLSSSWAIPAVVGVGVLASVVSSRVALRGCLIDVLWALFVSLRVVPVRGLLAQYSVVRPVRVCTGQPTRRGGSHNARGR